jgi:AcrR family transcriptional regulator
MTSQTLAVMSASVITYHRRVGRWEPEAQRRLRDAAIELFTERGYEQTTVAEIAQTAGLTARTFFRYFSDKREVLFAGSLELQGQLVTALANAPATANPMQAAATALDAAAQLLGADHEHSRRRQSVIAANAELRERELIKMALLSAALADGLRKRGIPDLDAALVAETAICVLRVAFERWVQQPAEDLPAVIQQALGQLRALSADA